MKKLLFALGSVLFSKTALANPACPVCMVTVGASLYLAEKSGLDRCVIGVWSGALLAIFGYFILRWMNRKNWHFPHRDSLIMTLSIASVGLMYIPQMPGGLPYHPIVIGFLYIDSFLFSNIAGALIFIAGIHFYEWMKARNGGHAHFPFEKVVVPVAFVALLSTLFYYHPLCDCATQQASADTFELLEK